MPATETCSKEHTANVIYHCKRCKATKRVTHAVRSQSTHYTHPTVFSLSRWEHKYWIDGKFVGSPLQYSIPCNCKPLWTGHVPTMKGKAIEGYLNEKVKCDSRCTGAKGHNCECSCGGKNHGSDWH